MIVHSFMTNFIGLLASVDLWHDVIGGMHNSFVFLKLSIISLMSRLAISRILFIEIQNVETLIKTFDDAPLFFFFFLHFQMDNWNRANGLISRKYMYFVTNIKCELPTKTIDIADDGPAKTNAHTHRKRKKKAKP